jgi:hypothetical protein
VCVVGNHVCVVRRENVVHGIEHRAERKDSAIHVMHAFDGKKYTALALADRSILVQERAERRNAPTLLCAKARRDWGGLHTDMHRGVNGLVVEQGISRLRHACEEARKGVGRSQSQSGEPRENGRSGRGEPQVLRARG